MRIAMISGAGAGAAGIAYVSLAANPAASAALPAVLAFAACPAMCAAMGGAMWLSRRFKRRNNVMQIQTSKNNVNEQLAGQNQVESRLGDDKEVVQIQYQNRRKRKAKQADDVDAVNST